MAKKIVYSDLEWLMRINGVLAHNRIRIPIVLVACAWFIFTSGRTFFVDDLDNQLGGWLIARFGELPYTGFFSHHAPLQYWVAYPFALLFGPNPAAMRLGLGVLLAAWMVVIYLLARRRLGELAGVGVVVGIAATTVPVSNSLYLAEVFVGFAILHAVMIFAPFHVRTLTNGEIATLSLLVWVVAGSSISYVPISAAFIVWALIWQVGGSFLQANKRERLRRMTASLVPLVGFLVIPGLVFVAYLTITGSRRAFIDQAIRFNTEIYIPLTTGNQAVDGFLQSLVTGLRNIVGSLTRNPDLVAAWPEHVPFLATLLAWSAVIGIVVVAVRGRILAATALAGLVVLTAYRAQTPLVVGGTVSYREQLYAMAVIAVLIVAVSLRQRSNPSVGADAPNSGDIAGRENAIAPLAPQGRSTFSRSRTYLSTVGVCIALAVSATLAVTSTVTSVQTLRTEGVWRAITSGSGFQANHTREARDLMSDVLVAVPDSTYFSGPLDFRTQIGLPGERSSIFTFFVAWHTACASCVIELMDSLTADRPAVIQWTPGFVMVGAPVDPPPLIDLLRSQYVRVENVEARSVWIRADLLPVVQPILDERGYTTLSGDAAVALPAQ